jgi:signal transduction histidine kinase
MSHEARTPLNGILGFSDLILSSPEMSAEDIQEYVLDIYKCGSSFLQLVEMILLLCDLKSRRRLRLQELCVKEVVLSGLRGVEAFAENSGVKVQIDIEEMTATIEAEVMQRGVNAVLASLVESAAEGDKIHIKGYSQSRHFVLALSAPVFFEPDYLERAFVGFSSNDIAHHSKLGDLGFSVAKLVAQKHFGSFEVKSEKATGTELKFFLPLV